MKTLVTGAAGFIGSTLVDRLLADGHDVVAVDDLSTGRLQNLEAAQAYGSTYRFAKIDITTKVFVSLVNEVKPDVIFHLAAQVDVRVSVEDPWLDARLNVLGTISVCEAAQRAGVRKVIFTSSGGTIYGSPAYLPAPETTPVNPLSPYAVSKVSGELYLAAFNDMYGLDWTSLALGNVYGPRQDPHGEAGVVAIFGTAMLERRKTQVFGDGSSTRDYVFVDDVVEALVRTASSGGRRRFNIGTGIQTTVLDLHHLIAVATGVLYEPVHMPPRTGELQAIALDATAARNFLGWVPATDLATGVGLTIDWLRTTLS
jgi:UDP-glucose 4-epimerase